MKHKNSDLFSHSCSFHSRLVTRLVVKSCRSLQCFLINKHGLALKGGFHGSAHVSKSKYFCSLLINVFASKTPPVCSSVITCYSKSWQNGRKILVRVTCPILWTSSVTGSNFVPATSCMKFCCIEFVNWSGDKMTSIFIVALFLISASCSPAYLLSLLWPKTREIHGNASHFVW